MTRTSTQEITATPQRFLTAALRARHAGRINSIQWNTVNEAVGNPHVDYDPHNAIETITIRLPHQIADIIRPMVAA